MKQSFKDIVTRTENAKNSFYNYVMEQHQFTKEQAQKILETYLKLKLIKLDCITGQFKIKHGAYLDKDILENALIFG